MNIIYNHTKNPMGAIGRVWKDENLGLVLNDVNGKGKILFLDSRFKGYIDEFCKYEFKGDISLTNNGLFYIMTPTELYKIVEKNGEIIKRCSCLIPKEYVYGGKIRLFYTNNTSELFEATCVADALEMSDKKHLYAFYQTE